MNKQHDTTPETGDRQHQRPGRDMSHIQGWGADLDHAIDEYRLSRVAAAVEAVAHRYAENGEDIRIDVILLAPGSFPRHIANAWQP